MMRAAKMPPWFWTLATGFLLLMAATAAGCDRRAGTTDDCRAILDRLIQLELSESGYRDPVVIARWISELTQKLAPELPRCQGKKVPDDLRACLSVAQTPEEIAHRCLK
jgi:hypothetical protein